MISTREWINQNMTLDGKPVLIEEYHKNGSHYVVELLDDTIRYYKDDNRHREDGPAEICYEDQELKTVVEENYWLNGKLHREGGPAYIEYADGEVVYEEWATNGKLHRVDGPARIEKNWIDEDVYIEYRYYEHGMSHRDDGPADYTTLNGEVIEEIYYVYGKRHRIGGPAFKDRYGEFWYNKGKLHRIDVPAWIRDNNKLYYYDGRKYPYALWRIIVFLKEGK